MLLWIVQLLAQPPLAAAPSRRRVLGATLDVATTQYLLNNKSPSRKVNELDNRGTHFYVAMYWAQALASQTDDAELSAQFAPIAEVLANNENTIIEELNSAQGNAMDIGGYYQPHTEQATKAMRPSATMNGIIDGWLFKMLMAFIDTPIIYGVIHLLRNKIPIHQE